MSTDMITTTIVALSMPDESELGGGWGSGKEEWRVDVYPGVGTVSNHWL